MGVPRSEIAVAGGSQKAPECTGALAAAPAALGLPGYWRLWGARSRAWFADQR
jgi:hypothetical protein